LLAPSGGEFGTRDRRRSGHAKAESILRGMPKARFDLNQQREATRIDLYQGIACVVRQRQAPRQIRRQFRRDLERREDNMTARGRKTLTLARAPREAVTICAFAIAIFGVVATGSAISASMREPSPWLFAAAYGGPAAIAAGLYWALAQRVGGLRSARDFPLAEAYSERCDWELDDD